MGYLEEIISSLPDELDSEDFERAEEMFHNTTKAYVNFDDYVKLLSLYAREQITEEDITKCMKREAEKLVSKKISNNPNFENYQDNPEEFEGIEVEYNSEAGNNFDEMIVIQ